MNPEIFAALYEAMGGHAEAFFPETVRLRNEKKISDLQASADKLRELSEGCKRAEREYSRITIYGIFSLVSGLRLKNMELVEENNRLKEEMDYVITHPLYDEKSTRINVDYELWKKLRRQNRIYKIALIIGGGLSALGMFALYL